MYNFNITFTPLEEKEITETLEKWYRDYQLNFNKDWYEDRKDLHCFLITPNRTGDASVSLYFVPYDETRFIKLI
jgi:hypothetical protein